MDNIIDILFDVQQKLKAPKNQYNQHGKFKYRSCEDIVEAVKPLLVEHGAVLFMDDDLVQIGDRFYVRSTVAIMAGSERWSAHAFAREPLEAKGMAPAMITGASSSYARKYALSGLFALDDSADADVTSDEKPRISDAQVDEIRALLEETGSDEAAFLTWLKRSLKAESIEDIAEEVFDDVIRTIARKKK